MLVKHYIVTYNNNNVLSKSLETLKPTLEMYDSTQYQLYIINNHSNFDIDDYFKDRVTILNNETRPDFSTGHLTRNWNQAIINGFVNLKNPNCDFVITSQNDTTFTANFLAEILKLHTKYDLIQFGAGDTFMSYSPNAIRKIGLWDERFCNIGYQESDYFFRAYRYLGDTVSINDFYHGRVHNSVDNKVLTEHFKTGHLRGEQSHLESLKYHKYQLNFYLYKWHSTLDDIKSTSLYWDDLKSFKSIEPKIESYIYYPYFEKDYDVDTFVQQKYVGWRNF